MGGWETDDPRPLFSVMQSCLSHLRTAKPYRTGALGLTAQDLTGLLLAAQAARADSPEAARRFFEEETVPFLILRDDGSQGFVTAFYEPEVDVSDRPDSGYRYPFYRRPADLIDLEDKERPAGLDASYVFARRHGEDILPYPDRREIDQGYLDGQGLEIAWARSKVDVFFAHVQGAARLRYADGRIRRITYSAKAGHPFSAIGKLLIDRGEIPAAEISMQAIRAWLDRNPAQVDEVLWHNRSYIFFRDAAVDDPALGPIAAAKVPLLAGRSLAVDRQIHTFGFPFFIRSETLTHLDEGKPFARLMMALDTGSAIVGPSRGDIFTGSGDRAGDLAGTVRNPADFFLLVPKAAAGRMSG
ncbi:murein transglycosylase A [Rhizobium sp. SSA_523]|uniref:murein transglycosylase A n=1 Tax=Rhizobium sp. SSA_523 TaxID=2952477 RepID=UPI0020916F5D|nr:murein transglycosylase A [Rhizobium sp. SSA_523]MCO5734628.1 murein transglycosylase A [Rhizobium sp. SSA_523]WKC25777.1 murein transglycosylase A [Rhizobium sp. SSA_523]